MPKKPTQLPLKSVLSAIDKRDATFYNKLNDEQKKEFNPWLLMRFCSNVQGKNAANYIYLTNELVNKNFNVVKSPELHWLSLKSCGSGSIESHSFIKPPNTKKKKDKIVEFLQEHRPQMKLDDINLLIQINSVDELKEFAKGCGYDDKTIKDIFK